MAQLSYCEELEALTKYNDPENAEERNLYGDIDSAILKLVRNGKISTLPRFIKSNPNLKIKDVLINNYFSKFCCYDWNLETKHAIKKIKIMTHIHVCKDLCNLYGGNIKNLFESMEINYLVSMNNAMLFLKTFKKYLIINSHSYRNSNVDFILDACKYGTLDTVKYLCKYNNHRSVNLVFVEDMFSSAFENKNTNILEHLCKNFKNRQIYLGFVASSSKITLKKINILLKYMDNHSHDDILTWTIKNPVLDYIQVNSILVRKNFTITEYDNYYCWDEDSLYITNDTLFDIYIQKAKDKRSHNNMVYKKCLSMFRKNIYMVNLPIKNTISKYLNDYSTKIHLLYTIFEKILLNAYLKYTRRELTTTIMYLFELNDYNTIQLANYHNNKCLGEIELNETYIKTLFYCGINLTKLFNYCTLKHLLTNPIFLKYYRVHRILYKKIKSIQKKKRSYRINNFKELVSVIPKMNTCKPKRIIPIHFTPLNFLKFLINNSTFYVTPKANGVYDVINLSMFYPYIDLYSIRKVNFESEKMSDNNIHYVFGNYDDLIKLRKLHNTTSSLTISHYVANNQEELLYIYNKEKELIKTFIDENKDNNEPLWYPKLMVKITNPEVMDYKALHDGKTIDTEFDNDGWIFINKTQDEIYKMKPNEHLTIDLVYRNGHYTTHDKHIINCENGSCSQEPIENEIYRCYYDSVLKTWNPRETRADKKTANSLDIVKPINDYFSKPWNYNVLLCNYMKYYKGDFYYNKDKFSVNSFKHMIPNHENTIIKKYSNRGTILDLGCGYKSEQIMKKYQAETYIGLDAKLIGNKNTYLCNLNTNWKDTLKLFYGIDCGSPKVILCLNAIHFIDDCSIFQKNLKTISNKNTVFIIRYLDSDLLKTIMNPGEIIQYNENYVKYTNEKRDTIKYYYSHCHDSHVIEKVLSLDDLKMYLGDWELIDSNTITGEPDDHPWKKYLNCFRVVVFRCL